MMAPTFTACVIALLWRQSERLREQRNRASNAWKKRNQLHCLARTQKWRRDNPGKAALAAKLWRTRHPEASAASASRSRFNNPSLRFRNLLAGKVRKRLNGIAKSVGTLELIGCSIESLKQHLASQFQAGMSWENYSYRGWHIDHKRPCASFDLTDPAQQKACFHYTNLQPLWAKDNLSKGAKYEHDVR